MTDSQRNCFLAVAEHRSFSKAASALYVSQPAVSKNISTLEAEIGTTLFDRQGKYISLTRAGDILYRFFIEYQRELSMALERISALNREGHSGSINIGCDITWNAGHFYPRLVRHFNIHYPGIRLNIEGCEPENFLTALRKKELDLVIMHTDDTKKQPDIEVAPLLSIGCGFVCSSLILPKDCTEPQLRDLESFPFLLVENPIDKHSNYIYKHVISSLCEKEGFTPRFSNSKSLSAAVMDISCGKGVMLAYDWTACISNPEFRYISTGELTSLCLAHLASPSDSLLSLVVSETQKVLSGNY